jgi:hypothetical protein
MIVLAGLLSAVLLLAACWWLIPVWLPPVATDLARQWKIDIRQLQPGRPTFDAWQLDRLQVVLSDGTQLDSQAVELGWVCCDPWAHPLAAKVARLIVTSAAPVPADATLTVDADLTATAAPLAPVTPSVQALLAQLHQLLPFMSVQVDDFQLQLPTQTVSGQITARHDGQGITLSLVASWGTVPFNVTGSWTAANQLQATLESGVNRVILVGSGNQETWETQLTYAVDILGLVRTLGLEAHLPQGLAKSGMLHIQGQAHAVLPDRPGSALWQLETSPEVSLTLAAPALNVRLAPQLKLQGVVMPETLALQPFEAFVHGAAWPADFRDVLPPDLTVALQSPLQCKLRASVPDCTLLDVHISGVDVSLQGEITLNASVVNVDKGLLENRGLQMPFTLHAARNGRSGELAYRLAGRLDNSDVLARWLPPSTPPLRVEPGDVNAEGKVAWGADFKVTAQGSLRHWSVHREPHSLKDVTVLFDVELNPATLYLKSPLQVQIEKVASVLPAGQAELQLSGSINYPVPSRCELKLDTASIDVFDGKVRLASPIALECPLQHGEFWVELRGLDLAQLVALEHEHIEAAGRISGVLPLTWDAGSMSVSGGQVAAEAGGWIRLRDVNDWKSMAGSNEQMMFAINALENFNYSALTSQVEFTPEGLLQLGISMQGSNPEVRGGQQIIYNLNVDTNIVSLLKSLEMADDISRRLQKNFR